ncbi:PREDICTED: uncharacterized protein LOC104815241 isoform X1 [Tarenaya hassleriana]|uniref:uncharacterized protein LOC104815241 isoform X1 n=1 Tax=Tarenaya hassleriana TaxID=28532 RepID=UPI00053C4AF4|nr:PREDICTED: uncharacterized protein LOC104815241 isoform X1 [Tarenaya hassleriana]
MPPKDKDHKVERLEEAMNIKMGHFESRITDVHSSVASIQRDVATMMEKMMAMMESQRAPGPSLPPVAVLGEISSASQSNLHREGKAPLLDTQMLPTVTEIIDAPLPPDTPRGEANCAQFIAGADLTYRKIEMPVFEGSNVAGWVARAERYFRLGHVAPAEWLNLASLSIDGEVLHWYDWQCGNRPFTDWSDFKQRLLRRFDYRLMGSVGARLFSLHQQSSVLEYLRGFEELLAQLVGVPEFVLECGFKNGLRADLRNGIEVLNPLGLEATIELAFRLERTSYNMATELSKSSDHRSSKQSPGAVGNAFRTVSIPTGGVGGHPRGPRDRRHESLGLPALGPLPGAQVEPTFIPPKGTFRKISDTEMEDRRKRGLCFRCDEKYFFGHKCKLKELQVIVVQEDGETLLAADAHPDPVPEEPPVAPEIAELSLNFVVGLTSPKTLKLQGSISKLPVIVMVDSGATHNFISWEVIRKLRICPETTTGYGVSLGTGLTVQGDGICKGLSLIVQDFTLVADFLPLKLGSADVILGIQWLRTLGRILVDFDKLELRFGAPGHQVILRGNPNLHSSLVTFKSLSKSVLKGEDSYLIEMGVVTSESEFPIAAPPEFRSVLDRFVSVFQAPSGLPPERTKDHPIQLLPGAGPISVRPYRYPHAHKEEIEKLVREMLQAGIIQPSHSPFSSPVLLVKKKDGSWRFCVDYCALNRVTVPDKFPIPMIDQLLDELFGAVIFLGV